MRRALGLIAVPLLVAACSRSRQVNNSPSVPTLCIENAAAAVGTINAATSVARWHVLPGQTECKPIPAAAPTIIVRAESIGGGAAGPVRYQTRVPNGPGCWHWRLTDSASSQESLWGCDQQQADSARRR